MSEKECIPLFPIEEIPKIFDLIKRYAPSLKKNDMTELEDLLSDRLYNLIRKDKYIRTSPFTPLREFRVYNDSSENHTGRIDINFICPGGVETYFALEAKRLHVTFDSGWKSLISEYVTSNQGMMCFITGKYSLNQQVGAMLGYVFDGDLKKAREGISNSISDNNGMLKVVDPKQLVASLVSNVDQTKHLLESRTFTIYHLLIPV